LRRRQHEAGTLERAAQPVTLGLEKAGEPGAALRLLAEIGSDGVLERVRDAECVELVHLAQLARERRRRHAVADAEPCGVQGLAEGEHGEAPGGERGVREHRSMPRRVEY